MGCTWKEVDGRYQCQATHCPHHLKNGGCELGKVTLTCDNYKCKWNYRLGPGTFGCNSMDVHLDANGQCLHKNNKN